MRLHPAIKQELDSLEIQFGAKAYLTLDDYAKLYSIKRRQASQHLKRRGIPATKEGREIYISTLDIAEYKAKRKVGPGVIIKPMDPDEMKNRRGFNQMADRKKLGF